MDISLERAAELIKTHDDILVLSHTFPDGDTLGSAAALCRALKTLGKRFIFRCDQNIPLKFGYLFHGIEECVFRGEYAFEPKFIVSVDVADMALLGSYGEELDGRIDLCIDHHGANRKFAEYVYTDVAAAATCEIIFKLLALLNVKIDIPTAEDLFTGITTDTGCFRYRNTTSDTFFIASELMKCGIDASGINFRLFEVKTKARLFLEKRILEEMEFHCGGKIALIVLSQIIVEETGAEDDDLDGISALPRLVEGVAIGITMRERADGAYKISLRTNENARACDICALFGGGGHAGAAGCTLSLPLEKAKSEILGACINYLENHK